jgi:mannonate dehydratase
MVGDRRSRCVRKTWSAACTSPLKSAIKSQTGPVREHLEAYKRSLANLAACGIKTVCYNFMPVLDWTRTRLDHPLPNGGNAMRFDLVDFVAFDCFILHRQGAEDDYAQDTLTVARERFARLCEPEKKALLSNIVAGLPGANDNWSLDDVKLKPDEYAGITPGGLRANLIDFLSEIVPVAENLGVRLCCHPDDPPFPLLGLPRVMSSLDNYEKVLAAVDSPANGVTFCTGSLGVSADFDPVAFIELLGPRIHFVHLRNTTRDGSSDRSLTSFREAEHLIGDTDMVATIRALMTEEARRRTQGRSDHEIPMRPDHGHALLSDLERPTQPGYPLIGRMRGLAELRGVMLSCT